MPVTVTNIDRIIRIDNFVWKLQMSSSGELQLAFNLPDDWSDTRNSGLWQDWGWDNDDNDDYLFEVPPPQTDNKSITGRFRSIYLLNGGNWVSEIPTHTTPLMISSGGKTIEIKDEIVREALPVFRLIREVMKLLPGYISQHHLSHFHFIAENPDKGRIYHRLASRITQTLGPGWTHQVIDEKWFYFVKTN